MLHVGRKEREAELHQKSAPSLYRMIITNSHIKKKCPQNQIIFFLPEKSPDQRVQDGKGSLEEKKA